MIWKDGFQVIGPAFLVSVAYLDPGNWATAIESGSRFGYRQLWVLVLANLIAIQLQTLSSRLGLVSGKHLAQVCRDSYPPIVCRLLWIMTEISIVALDLTMVLGTAVGLNLLFKMDPVTCILLTALDVLALFLLVPQTAVRQAEQWTAILVFAVLGCFIIDLFISQPPFGAVMLGLVPSIRREDLFSAVSLLGANIMPHNFYLHSALVAGQSSRDDKVTARRCFLNSLDVACALGLALLVNVAVLLVAASAFHSEGVQVASLQEAHDLLEQILNSHLAPLAFGLALLLTGQMSTFTSTIAGQVVMSGFLGVKSSPLSRRLSTRALAVLPALYVQINYGTEGTYKMLVVAQVVLAMQLPFTLIPLIKATSSRAIMGSFASSWITSMTAWASSAAVSIANVLMILDMLWKEASESAADPSGEVNQQSFTEWLTLAMMNMMQSPMHLLSTFGVAAFTGCALALLMWMGVHPVCVRNSLRSPHLKRKPHASGSELAAWDTSDGENDLETGSLEPVSPRVSHAMYSNRLRCDLSDSDAPTTFVQRLFADLPMQYVWRAVASFRGAMSGTPARTPLTPALLAIHTSSMQLPEPHVPQPQPGAVPRASSTFVPHLLLDQQTRSRLQAMHRHRSEDAISVTPSMLSDTSIRSTFTLEGMQSLQSSATQATEPGGGKGHRMGRASRKQFALSVCKLWKKYFDAHGKPLPSSTQHSSISESSSQPQQPAVFCCGRSAALAVLEGLDELKQIPGIESLLEQVSEGSDSLSRWPSQSLFSQPQTDSASVSTKLTRLAGLGERLALCTACVHASCACSQQLHSALQSTAETGSTDRAQPGWSASGGVSAVLLASADWRNIAEKMSALWRHLLQQEDECDGAPTQKFDSTINRSDSSSSFGAGMQAPAAQHVGATEATGSAAGMSGDNELLRWSRSWSDSSTRGRSARGDRLKLIVERAESWPNLLFVTFGIWCMAALLQLASVEPRPELWGRYVAALNHLQGVLFVSVSMCAQLRGNPGWAPQGWTGSCDIAVLSSFGMVTSSGNGNELDMREAQGVKSTCRELEAMHKELLHLIQMVESHVNSCGCSHQRTTSAAAAFAKGKVNIVSVIKRLRNHVVSGERYKPGTAGKSQQAPQVAQQHHIGQAGDSSGSSRRWQHRGSGQGKEQHSTRAFGSQRKHQHNSPNSAASSTTSQDNWRSGISAPSPQTSPHAKGRW